MDPHTFWIVFGTSKKLTKYGPQAPEQIEEHMETLSSNIVFCKSGYPKIWHFFEKGPGGPYFVDFWKFKKCSKKFRNMSGSQNWLFLE